MKPILIEIITPLLTSMEFGCSRCDLLFGQTNAPGEYRRTCAEEFPEDWRLQSAQLTETLRRLTELYKHRVRFRLIDAQSFAGLWKQIRHRIRKLPAFVVENQDVCIGLSQDKLEELIDTHMRASLCEITRAGS